MLNVQLINRLISLFFFDVSLDKDLSEIDVACVSMFDGVDLKHSVNSARWPFVADCRKRLSLYLLLKI